MTVQPGNPPVRALPLDTAAENAFWTGGRDGQLVIDHCRTCCSFAYPPRDTCAQCGSALQPRAVSGLGKVFTFTVNHQQFHPEVPPPYVIALVELDEQPGLRLPANIVDCQPDQLYIGMPVAVRFEQQGQHFVPVFAPPRTGALAPDGTR